MYDLLSVVNSMLVQSSEALLAITPSDDAYMYRARRRKRQGWTLRRLCGTACRSHHIATQTCASQHHKIQQYCISMAAPMVHMDSVHALSRKLNYQWQTSQVECSRSHDTDSAKALNPVYSWLNACWRAEGCSMLNCHLRLLCLLGKASKMLMIS